MDPVRSDYLDYTMPINEMPQIIYVSQNQRSLDFSMILKPFSPLVWLVLPLLTCLLSAALIIPKEIFDVWRDTWISHRIIVLSSWTIFVLVNSYYAGTLTMFFATDTKPPFENLEEAIALYPKLRMIAHKSTSYLLIRRRKKDKLINDYLEELSQSEHPLYYEDYEELFALLQSPGYFLYEGMVVNMFQEHKKLNGPQLTTISTEDMYYGTLLFPKYSPLTKIVNAGTIY